ncbi:S26 family signal peptidase [Micromonospora sp. DT31]|uniref:S26 family signal peptidase n=1 Tax=Micromonospora sp. DT31 TaxID=3393434 RepID=UPI003CF7AF9F
MSTALPMIWWLRRSLVVVSVTGESMVPTLFHGDSLLVRRVHRGRVRRDRVVVLELPRQQPEVDDPPVPAGGPVEWSVKRVVGLPGDPTEAIGRPGGTVPAGFVTVAGDNATRSYDSRHVGPVPVDRLLGVVVARMPMDRRDDGRTGRPVLS